MGRPQRARPGRPAAGAAGLAATMPARGGVPEEGRRSCRGARPIDWHVARIPTVPGPARVAAHSAERRGRTPRVLRRRPIRSLPAWSAGAAPRVRRRPTTGRRAAARPTRRPTVSSTRDRSRERERERVADERGEHGAPSWEHVRRYEAYPSIKARAGLPSPPQLPRIDRAGRCAPGRGALLFLLPTILNIGGRVEAPGASASPIRSGRFGLPRTDAGAGSDAADLHDQVR